MKMIELYGKDGSVIEREPVDARECLLSGFYSYMPWEPIKSENPGDGVIGDGALGDGDANADTTTSTLDGGDANADTTTNTLDGGDANADTGITANPAGKQAKKTK